MKHLFSLILILLMASIPATAKTTKHSSGHLSTDISFEDMAVRGKYQYADEAVAIVENEKILQDLLGVRKDFKDRLKRETKRR